MPAVTSSVLLIGIHSAPKLALDYQSIPRLDLLPEKAKPDVLVLPLLLAKSDLFKKKFLVLFKKDPSLQIILLSTDEADVGPARDLIEELPIFRLLETIDDPSLESSLLAAIEKANWSRQNLELHSLVQEQTEKLKNLYQQLEDRVERRSRFLEEARRRSLLAQERWETLRQVSVGIHQSSSVSEIESRLLEILASHFGLKGLRIVLGAQDLVTQGVSPLPFSFHRVTLFDAAERAEGSVIFFRDKDLSFTHEEREFFQQIAETLNPALQKLTTLKNRENFKEEWEATFNAVPDPVLILSPKYEILQTNRAAQTRAETNESLGGLLCYQALFHRDQPCQQCRLGEKFRSEIKKETYEVTSQAVLMSPEEPLVFVNQYHDITEQIRMERRILESTRLAEIGTIGSSIAHELNNPLAGMLSYIQLLKMDLPAEDPLRIDIEEMEKGVLRCKDIVQNLLNFTRSPGSDQKIELDLRDVIRRAISIIELKTRSYGLELKLNLPREVVALSGHFNQLTQAIQNVLQSSVNSIQDRLLTQKGYSPIIELTLISTETEVTLSVIDNGQGSESTPSLDIPLAKRILLEHGANLDIQMNATALRTVKIVFRR